MHGSECLPLATNVPPAFRVEPPSAFAVSVDVGAAAVIRMFQPASSESGRLLQRHFKRQCCGAPTFRPVQHHPLLGIHAVPDIYRQCAAQVRVGSLGRKAFEPNLPLNRTHRQAARRLASTLGVFRGPFAVTSTDHRATKIIGDRPRI